MLRTIVNLNAAICLLFAILCSSSIVAEISSKIMSHSANADDQLAIRQDEQTRYTVKINIATAIPEGASLLCYIDQIQPKKYNIPGKTWIQVSKSGEVTLELLQSPKPNSEKLFQLRIDNFGKVYDRSNDDLLLYYSEPFILLPK